MAVIIKDRQVVSDPWLRLEAGPDGDLPAIPATGDLIVPLALWRSARKALLARPGRIGICLGGNDDPAAIADDLGLLGVVAVDFPKLTDGRGYSLGRLLRERYGWRGELRAVGDILRDQLVFLSACGFDAYVLRAGEDPHEALGAFSTFSEAYQASVERPLPLYRRRRALFPGGVK